MHAHGATAMTGTLAHMAMLAHTSPHGSVRAAGFPAPVPGEVVMIGRLTAWVHPPLMDVAAARPVGMTVKAAAKARWVASDGVRLQIDALLAAADRERLALDRSGLLQILVPCVDHQFAGVLIGKKLGFGRSILQRDDVAAVRARHGAISTPQEIESRGDGQSDDDSNQHFHEGIFPHFHDEGLSMNTATV